MENNDEQINENDAKNEPTMSKNQIKKQKRREKLLKNRMEKRKLEREKRKEKKQKNGGNRTKIQLNLMSESKCGIRVAIDMAFDELMDEKTVKKTISQLAYSYSANRRATNPLQFYIVNFDGKAKEIFDSIPSYSHWDAHIKTESLKELWNAEEICYLTADSENILEKLDENKVYVIGGLLDHNHHKGICLEKAKTNGFGHARLPIDSFFRLSGRKVLTINQVFEIIVRFSQDQNWEKAFLEVIPKRKGIELKGIDDEGQNESIDL